VNLSAGRWNLSEWPLVAFTMALQLACGLCLASTICDGAAQPSSAELRSLGAAVFPIAALGLLASLAHLGRPSSALRSLANLGSSRLSQEILLTSIFLVAALIYSFLCWKELAPGRVAAGTLASLAGFAAVVSSSSIYVVRAQPAWDSGWLPLSFVATVLIFAGISTALVPVQNPRIARILLATGTVGSLTLLASALWLIAHLARGPADPYVAAKLQHGLQLVASNSMVWFAVFLGVAVIAPIAFAVRFWPGSEVTPACGSVIRAALFLVTLSGTVAGRILMYALQADR
jgi:anaerobic dimethyl sulfoxide reductase subunit C (anchor subunit)